MSWTPPPSSGAPTWVGPYASSAPAPWGPPPAGLGFEPGPPRPAGTDGMAIAALIFGIIGWILVSVPLGIAALIRTRRTGRDGRGLAAAGLALSALWAVLAAVVAVVLLAAPAPAPGSSVPVTTSAPRPTATPTPTAGSNPVPVNSLQVGDCVNGLTDSQHLLSLPSVPCAQAHEGEVFAVFDLPPGRYPGGLTPAITQECARRFPAYAPTANADGIGLYVVYPRAENWARGNREIDCIATANGGTTSGSLRGPGLST